MTGIDEHVGVYPRHRVATYRAYRTDRMGRRSGVARLFEATDDVTAVVRAGRLMGHDDKYEIWQGARQLALPPVPGDTANE